MNTTFWMSGMNGFVVSDLTTTRLFTSRRPPETALTRLRHRGREEEIKVNLDYLTLIHDLYEDWISSIQQSDSATVTIIDQERPIASIIDSANHIYSSLSDKLLTN